MAAEGAAAVDELRIAGENRLEQGGDLTRPVLLVSVADDDVVTSRLLDSACSRCALPLIPSLMEYPDPRIVEFVESLAHAIATSVVHDDQLDLDGLLVGDIEDAVDCLPQCCLLVLHGHQDDNFTE